MKLFYLVGFDVHKSGGKSRATRQKMNVLSSMGGDVEVLNFFPYKNIPIFLSLPLLEIYVFLLIFIKRPSGIISRGCVGFLPLLACRLLGISYFREVHADIKDEVSLIRKGKFLLGIYKVVAEFTHFLDVNSESILFNHPLLLEKYCKKYSYSGNSFYSYNGYDTNFSVVEDLNNLRNKYNIPEGRVILSFTGSVSEWHGIDYIYEISKFLQNIAPEILILVAGGKLPDNLRRENILNISPLDSTGCDEIIQISHACLLPVKNNRVSPGSPLKLYDYIKYKAFVFAQEHTLGYSDEVLLYGNGILLDFSDTESAARVIAARCKSAFLKKDIDIIRFSWQARMLAWIKFIEQSNEC
ncbi:hypothetical protein [Rheinheimera sp.]|uniref:hypothetical protein n=1 Tax=Rheinheimera sp. TaxID=1869214 RepID=UPI00273549D0|nr:hypothetical protein [Rheinheimera sp.]MDP2715679.1 hypothetical protein [Rheinheimera sp.]